MVVERYTVTDRIAHTVHAIAMIVLIITGLKIYTGMGLYEFPYRPCSSHDSGSVPACSELDPYPLQYLFRRPWVYGKNFTLYGPLYFWS